MKRTMISIIIASIVFMPGCYDPGKNATVRINLGNIPLAKHVEKKSFIDKIFSLFEKEAYASYANVEYGLTYIHIAAISGDSVLASASIDATSPDIVTNGGTDIIELEVPAGSDRNIVVLGESAAGVITWYGKTARTYEFAAGDEVDVPVIMGEIFYYFFNSSWNSALARREWDKIVGASGYNIYSDPGPYYVGSTTNTYYPLSYFYLQAEFSFAGKCTNRFYQS